MLLVRRVTEAPRDGCKKYGVVASLLCRVAKLGCLRPLSSPRYIRTCRAVPCACRVITLTPTASSAAAAYVRHNTHASNLTLFGKQ